MGIEILTLLTLLLLPETLSAKSARIVSHCVIFSLPNAFFSIKLHVERKKKKSKTGTADRYGRDA